MNLHVTHDNGFINYIITATEELGLIGQNKFVIYSGGDSSNKLVKNEHALFANYGSDNFKRIVGNTGLYKNIYIHWLYDEMDDFVLSLPKDQNIVWCFWGGDGLEIPPLLSLVYQPQSLAYFKKTKDIFPVTINPVEILRFFKKKWWDHSKKNIRHLEAIKRVNYFAHYIRPDYDLIKQATKMNSQFLSFHYACAEDMIAPAELKPNTSSNILLGNSDTLPNNHFECINILAQMDLGNRKIICPLSYEKGKYANDVAAYGKLKLGSSFLPLLDFMPKEKYNELISSVGFGFMNHNRSQAFGNIMSLLYSGVRLFMSSSSTLYQHLVLQGFIINKISPELNTTDLLPLQLSEISTNRDLLFKYYGRTEYLKKIKSLLSL